MTEFPLFRNGKRVGTIDVTNRGIKFLGDKITSDLFEEYCASFIKDGSYHEDDDFFLALDPADTMMEMLANVRASLRDLGYEIIISA